MRKSSQPLATQLGSASLRYRLPWRGADTATLPGRRLLGWLTSGRRAEQSPVSTSGRERRMQRLESVLFLAREPLSSRKLSQYANLADGTEARTLIRRLNTIYDREGRAFHVVEVAGGFQLLTRAQFAPWLRRLGIVSTEVRLSAPAMETLAVVAYRQPVLRVDIEAVRGVACGEILRQLMERELVRISGRSEELGRPYLYSTAKRFQQLFGLRNLDDLPRREILSREILNGEISSELTNDVELIEDPQDLITEEECEVTVTGNMELHQDETFQTLAAIAPAEIQDSLQADVIASEEDGEYEDEDLDDDELDDDELEDDDDEGDEWEEVEDDDEAEEDEDEDDEEFEGDEWEEVDDEDAEEEDDDDSEEWEDDVDDDVDDEEDEDGEDEVDLL
jgi:segregation and condensation protein B